MRYIIVTLSVFVCIGSLDARMQKKKINDKKRLFTGHTQDANNKGVKLSHIYHQAAGDNAHIELGLATFLFSDDIVINQLPSATDECGYCRLIIPDTYIDSTVKNLQQLQSIDGKRYAIAIRSVNAPVRGIELEVQFDPQEILFERDVFKGMNGKRKLVLRFYDKKVLENVELNKDKPMLLYAHMHRSKIIIDCGHGGHDTGATANGISEKDICLAVGHKVAQLLKKKGYSPVLTRDTDQFISLEERRIDKNMKEPAIFVSIHANACGKAMVSGIETYYFDPLLGYYNVRSSTDMNDPMQKYAKEVSETNKRLAALLQSNVCEKIGSVINRGVKTQPFHVLMETGPAALIEIGFLTNSQEANLLAQDQYQEDIALGICSGIIKFIT